MNEHAATRLRVLFVHGLEGSPSGAKPTFLARHFETLAPAMDTRDFAASVELQARALRSFRPDVLVGSSFGGAVALELLRRGAWSGPTVLLAPAARAFGVPAELPAGARALVVHGVDDDVIDVGESRGLARTGDPLRVRLVEVPDGHRLQSLVDGGRLAELVREAAAL